MTFNVLIVLVIVNLLATFALWRAAARRPGKLKKKIHDRTAPKQAESYPNTNHRRLSANVFVTG